MNHATNVPGQPVSAFARKRGRNKQLIMDHLTESQLEVRGAG